MKQRTLIFSASAGSGKTFNLAVQYIALLIARSPHEFAHTLAVTFTNKATAEMKDRILEQLYGIGNGLRDSGDYLSCIQEVLRNDYKLNISDEEAKSQCKQALTAILHDYSRFNVSTIDTFFQSVLRNMAHELGLNARLQVDISNREIVEMAIDNLIEGLEGTNKELLPWLRRYIKQQIDSGKKWDIRGKLLSMASCLFKEEYLKRSLDSVCNKPFTMSNIRAFEKTLEQEAERAKTICQNEAETFKRVMEENGISYADISYGGTLENYVNNMSCGNASEANFGSRLAGMIDNPYVMLRKNDRNVVALCAAVEKLSLALSALRDVQAQASPLLVSIDKIRESLTPMGAFDAIDKEIKRINNENNRFSLSHTPTLLREMIKEDDAPFVFEKIGSRFKNIMIDEFQDTSSLQWENFKVLLINNLSQGGMNMVVGDIKQSIYRWRNGDWRILHQLQDDNPNDTISLDTNRRSQGNIILFNNDFFKKAASRLDEITPKGKTPLQNLYGGVAQKIVSGKENSGFVRVCIHKVEKGEGDWTVEMLSDMHRHIKTLHEDCRVPYGKMAILIRKRKYIDPIIKYFAENDKSIELVSDEAFYLRNSVANNMIINALYVLNEQDDPSSLPLRYLMKHYCGEGKRDANGCFDYCFAEPRAVLPETFLNRRDELRRLPLYELCEELYRCLNINKIEKQDAYVLCFFDELTAYLSDNASDLSSFLQYWEETMKDKTIPAGKVEGIRILTIHSAKGLQYHTVFIPYCDYSIEKDNSEDFLWCMPRIAPLNSLGTLPIPVSSRLNDSIFNKEYIEEHANKRADELNVLYVAFTRAEHNLLVWGQSQGMIDNNKTSETVGDLIAECVELNDEVYTVGQPSQYVAKEDKDETGNRINPTKTPETIKMHSFEGKIEFRQSSPAREFVNTQTDEDAEIDAKQLSYIERGKLLHYIFSQIATEKDVARVVTEMRERGIIATKRQGDEVASLAMRGLENDIVSDWFSGKYRLYNECSILSIRDNKLVEKRPDRVMVGDRDVIVVDFKFGRSRPEYKCQVEDYKNILQTMHPDKNVTGYLWYVYSNKIECV